jgi:tetratricopeptide (TPR) repeat protein
VSANPEDPRDDRFVDLFLAVCQMPAAERRPWLDHECWEDPELASEVLQSAAREEEMAGFLAEPLMPRPNPEPNFAPGDFLGERLRVVRRIAVGGMATIYEACDEKLGPVAVKVPKAPFRDKLIAEARHSLCVTHPNICRVHTVDTATIGGRTVDYLSMELLHGETLQSRLSREGPLQLRLLLTLTDQLCSGLAEAHRKGVVHADLKGSNVILTEGPGGELRAVLTDFGISRQQESGEALVAATLRGTPDFVAPELWEGKPTTPASDLYSLGVLLYEAATGVRPMPDVPKIVAPRKLRQELPERWSHFVVQCLERDPARRPASAAIAMPALQKKPRTVWGLAALAIALTTALGTYLLGPNGKKAEVVRLAIVPPDTDAESAAWGTGVIRHVADAFGRYRTDAGPVIVLPWANGKDADREAGAAHATHVVRTRFRIESGQIRAWGTLHHIPSNRDLRTFGGAYSTASMASIPQAIIGAISAALGLQGPPNLARIAPAAWPEYARGLAALQAISPASQEAIGAFTSASALDAASALPWARLSEAHLLKYSVAPKSEYLEAAKLALQEAQLRDPDDLDVHLVAGLYYTQAGLPERAVVELTRVLQKEPGNVDGIRRIARAYADMNLPDEAVKTWYRAIELLPTDYRTHLDLGQFYYRRSQYEEAVKHWGAVTQIAPQLARGFHNLGAALNDLGRFPEAEKAFARALELEENPNTLIGFGSIMSYQGRHKESAAYYERALKIGPPNHILLSNLGDAYRLTGRFAESREAYQKALVLADDLLMQQPRDAYVRAFVAYICARLRDRSRAERETVQALRFGPDIAKVVRTAALTYAALGAVDQAVSLIESMPSLKKEMARHPDLAEFAGKLRFTQ